MLRRLAVNHSVALSGTAAGMVLMATAVMAVSARDSEGLAPRAALILLVTVAALSLPSLTVAPVAVVAWLAVNYVRSMTGGDSLLATPMLLELPGLAGLAVSGIVFKLLSQRLSATQESEGGLDPLTGVYEERLLRPAVEAELTRSRRFGRNFALVLVDTDEKHQRFAFRDEQEWNASFLATAQLLKRTRKNIDRVYRHGSSGFAMLLPESGEREVRGLVRRLRKLAKNSRPREGESGGPLPVAFGATFYPAAATTVEDLLRRAEIALRVAEKNSARLQVDGAAAPAAEPPETMREQEALTSELPVAVESAMLSGDEPLRPLPARDEPPPVPVQLVPTPQLVTALRQETAVITEDDNSGEDFDLPEEPSAAQMTDEELTRLLGRLDETLGLIRGLRSQVS